MEVQLVNYNVKYQEISPPTYLKEFFFDDDEILLVYNQVEGCHETNNSAGECHVKTETNKSSNSLELTGNPLKVDLDGDDSFGPYVKDEKPNHWTMEESKHYPLTLKEARALINLQNKLKTREGEEQRPIFVVCDGSDPLHTVLLGAHKCENCLMTTLVNILGCYPKDHEIISFDFMEKDHIRNCREKIVKVDYLVRFQYYIYGTFLQSLKNFNFTEHHGSISVELICNNSSFSIPQNPSSMNMLFKIIAGHNISSVYFLWEELCLLQTFLDILGDSDKCNDELTEISKIPLDESDIYKNINDIITSNLLTREVKMKFDLKNIRQEHILDKLWSVLKNCNNLFVLRDTLHYFFEELAEAEINIKIPEADKSNIASIITGILNGKLAVPTLSFSQALECLFELGCEKLKNDYQAIIKNFYATAEQAISEKWSKFQKEELTSESSHPKTRITVNLKSGFMDLTHNTSKLAYLSKLHVATELIFLIRDQANMPEETFDYFCERVYKNYVDKDTAPHKFTDLQKSPLCEFEISLNSSDTSIIEKETPVTWTMQMTSKVRNLEIATVYHLSEYPIFPTSIYSDYDVSAVAGDSKMTYYVSKLVRYKEFI